MLKRFPILAIALLAILVRIGACIYVDAIHQPYTEDRAIAKSLIEGQGFSFQQFNYFGPTSIRPPVYPFVLAGVFKVFGNGNAGTVVALGLNLIASGIGVLAAFQIGRNLFRSPAAAICLAMLFALWPTQIVAATYLQGLSLAVCLLLLAIWLITSRQSSRVPIAGLCAGLAVLSESILVLPVAAILLWIVSVKPSRAMIAMVAAVCLIIPWVYRNYIIHDSFTGITNTLWTDIYLGNGPGASGSLHQSLRDYSGKPLTRFDLASPIELDQLKKQSELRRSEIFQKWSTDWISENRWEYFKLSITRIFKSLWMDWNHPRAWNVLNVMPRTIGMIALLSAVVLGYVNRKRTSRTFDQVQTVDPLDSVKQFFQKHKAIEPRLKLNPVALSVVLAVSLSLATALTMAEARNAVFLDIAELLAVATLVDKKREA